MSGRNDEAGRAEAPMVIVTYDWVPDFARGFVRDLRVRWAAEELGRAYRIETVPVREKSAAHRAMQPFEQVPILKDGDVSLFETGAIVWHLGETSEALVPGDRVERAETLQWIIAALNSVEPMLLGWLLAKVFDRDEAATEKAADRLAPRLARLSDVIETRDHLVGGRFSAADLIMSDVLRVADAKGGLGEYPALSRYVARQTDRPAFRRAYDAQMAHWADADASGPSA